MSLKEASHKKFESFHIQTQCAITMPNIANRIYISTNKIHTCNTNSKYV